MCTPRGDMLLLFVSCPVTYHMGCVYQSSDTPPVPLTQPPPTSPNRVTAVTGDRDIGVGASHCLSVTRHMQPS